MDRSSGVNGGQKRAKMGDQDAPHEQTPTIKLKIKHQSSSKQKKIGQEAEEKTKKCVKKL